jgi:hypothetical protein
MNKLKDRNDNGKLQGSSFRFIANTKRFILFVFLHSLALLSCVISLYGMEHLYPAHATIFTARPLDFILLQRSKPI